MPPLKLPKKFIPLVGEVVEQSCNISEGVETKTASCANSHNN
jgi:hypothetical protein